MPQEFEKHLDALRLMAQSENPFPDLVEMEAAYREFKHALPAPTFPDALPLTPDQISNSDLLIYASSSATVTPYAEITDPNKLYPYLALGQSAFELPPETSGMNQDYPTSFIRSRRHWDDTQLRERLEEAASETMANPRRAKEYIKKELPLATAWSTMAVLDALSHFNESTGNQILDGNGKLRREIAEQTIIINGDNGGGVASVGNLANRMIVFQESLPDALSPAQTGFVAASIGAENSLTVAAACAGFSDALNAAEIYTSSNKTDLGLVVVFAGFDGPTALTQQGFDSLGLPPSEALPYIGEEGIGYIETPGAAAIVLPTRKLAEQLGLPLENAYLMRSVGNQGKSKMGVERHRELTQGIPGATYERAFSMLDQYYPEGFRGNAFVLTHGTKTLGATLEEKILPAMRERHSVGRISVTSSQPLLGHQYSPRGGFSIAYGITANTEGVAWGMIPADRDLSVLGEDERLQALRRTSLQKASGKPITLTPINFKNERTAEKSARDLQELKEKGVDILLTSKRIPRSVILVTHQGLGGRSNGVLIMPCGSTR